MKELHAKDIVLKVETDYVETEFSGYETVTADAIQRAMTDLTPEHLDAFVHLVNERAKALRSYDTEWAVDMGCGGAGADWSWAPIKDEA